MRKILLCLAIASVSLLTGCGKEEAPLGSRPSVRSPKSPQSYEKLVRTKLQERNAREGTDFNVSAEAERMRQRYIKLSDKEKLKAYDDASEM